MTSSSFRTCAFHYSDAAVWRVGILDLVTDRAESIKEALSKELFDIEIIDNFSDLNERVQGFDAVLAYDNEDTLLHFLKSRAEAKWLVPVCAYLESPSWYRMIVSVRRGVTDYFPVKSISLLNERVVLACTKGKEELGQSFYLDSMQLMIDELSKREREVAELLSQGVSFKDTGEALGLAERTIEVHSHNIRKRLGIRSRYELMEIRFLLGHVG